MVRPPEVLSHSGSRRARTRAAATATATATRRHFLSTFAIAIAIATTTLGLALATTPDTAATAATASSESSLGGDSELEFALLASSAKALSKHCAVDIAREEAHDIICRTTGKWRSRDFSRAEQRR